jgi:1,4-dihydroxy-2-naphthoate octaprenyltransferase
MSRVNTLAAFWWDFLVGDDWRLTAGLLLALAATALLHHVGVPAWWLLPLALAPLLARSLRHATHGAVGSEPVSQAPPAGPAAG